MRTVAQIATLALSKIGAFTVSMVAPDVDELGRAIEWLDLNCQQLAGTGRATWLIPATVSKALTANTASYSLANFLGTDWPDDGILFPVSAWIRDAGGNDSEVEIVTRQKYESIENKTAGGTPRYVYMDRQTPNQSLSVSPVPTDGTVTLRLVFQKYSKNMLGGTPVGQGNIGHGFSSEWERWLINATAADIGSGPVRVLPRSEVMDMRSDANDAKEALLAYAAREHETSAPVVEVGMDFGGHDYGDAWYRDDYR